jgi:hypothetical protein
LYGPATEASPAEKPVTRASVTKFLIRLKELRDNDTSPAIERAGEFLDSVRLLRQDRTAEIAQERFEPSLTLDSWSSFASKFRSHYESERRNGTFLNVWDVAGLGRNEARNAAVFAWLLNARSTHGRDAAILHSLLQQLDPNGCVPFLAPSAWSDGYAVRTENYPGDMESRVDIVLQSSRHLILLEVKIDSEEGVHQVPRYLELARAKAKFDRLDSSGVIYLTKVGASLPATGISHEVIHATWRQVQRAIEAAVSDGEHWVDRLLIQFARHVSQF